MNVPLWRIALSIALLVLVLEPGTAWAGGYGAYLETEFSEAELTDDRLDRDFNAKLGGLGMLWDSHIAADNLLNYRLGVGYRLGRRSIHRQDNETVNGFIFDQTIGVSLLRSSRFRVWAGPSVRFNVDWYSSQGDLDIVDVGIGFGPRIGANYHLTDRLSLTSSLSFHYAFLSENIENSGSNQTYEGSQYIVGLRLGVFWRGEYDNWDE
jgi:hypothetical protein